MPNGLLDILNFPAGQSSTGVDLGQFTSNLAPSFVPQKQKSPTMGQTQALRKALEFERQQANIQAPSLGLLEQTALSPIVSGKTLFGILKGLKNKEGLSTLSQIAKTPEIRSGINRMVQNTFEKMAANPKRTFRQRGIEKIAGSLLKSPAFEKQLSKAPLSGKMLAHYLTGKGKPLKYTPTDDMVGQIEKRLSDFTPHPTGAKERALSIKHGFVRDPFTAVGTAEIKMKSLGNNIDEITVIDNYNFNPKINEGKNFAMQFSVPRELNMLLDEAPISLKRKGTELLRLYGGDPMIADDIAAVVGVDAVFPWLKLGKPFQSISKPLYRNSKVGKVFKTLEEAKQAGIDLAKKQYFKKPNEENLEIISKLLEASK